VSAPGRTTPEPAPEPRPAAPSARERREGAPAPGAGSERISKWEWATAALGVVLVVAAVGALLYEGLARPTPPPDVTVRVERVLPVRAGFLLEFVAVNRGSETAAGLTVRGELRARGAGAPALETREAALDYLPGRSERKGGLFYARDPRTHAVTLQALGYQEP
jgi:uncharacterized protein (TIGR02588 family)